MDLCTLWSQRRFRLLLNLIDHLPRASHFGEAIGDDDELAERRADGEQAPHRERLSEWSPERDLLASIFDRLGSLIATLVAVNGQRPPEIDPHPRPIVAAERARQKASRRKHERLVERLLPRTD